MSTTYEGARIFIVHGRDNDNVQALKAMLTRWGLVPIIMAEQPNSGRTLFEKLVDLASTVRYAIVLLTPDDVGSLKSEFTQHLSQRLPGWTIRMRSNWWNADELERRLCLKGRARQNVIFEYGMFVGQLTPIGVCLLKRGDLEFPTDISGVAHHQFRESVLECENDIRTELETADYSFRPDVRGFVWATGPGSYGRAVPENELPQSILAEVERIRRSPRTIGPVRVYEDASGSLTIQYDEI